MLVSSVSFIFWVSTIKLSQGFLTDNPFLPRFTLIYTKQYLPYITLQVAGPIWGTGGGEETAVGDGRHAPRTGSECKNRYKHIDPYSCPGTPMPPTAQSLTGSQIRQKFLDFFAERGHKVLPSASLVPEDPSVLLTGSAEQVMIFAFYSVSHISAVHFSREALICDSLSPTSVKLCRGGFSNIRGFGQTSWLNPPLQ
jgi:hypothetical protein